MIKTTILGKITEADMVKEKVYAENINDGDFGLQGNYLVMVCGKTKSGVEIFDWQSRKIETYPKKKVKLTPMYAKLVYQVQKPY
ncbi:hypothetical protein LCGC14_1408930 [marine sediment metagenome]|uniref:Uncharacterized protein n=1 Tax=marine sediment metagenome TaxID=412755 RepID=A0A0F9JUU9_9ZZZZ